jgi:hypothetical protein
MCFVEAHGRTEYDAPRSEHASALLPGSAPLAHLGRGTMKKLLIAAALVFASNAAFAANAACEAKATEQKLAGAAKTSFLKKCEKDAMDAATKACDAQAAEKKLSGAAKNSFVSKCVKEATAAAAAHK